MPTGYTAFVEDGRIDNAKDFIMLCTRNFGVAIDIKDKPLSEPTPMNFKSSEYWAKEKALYESELAAFKRYSLEDWKRSFCEKRKNEEINAESLYNAALEKFERVKKVYSEVVNWVPPMAKGEYKRLKEFAMEQLEISVEDLSYTITYYENKLKELRTPIDIDAEVLKYASETITLSTEHVKKAEEEIQMSIDKAQRKIEYMRKLVESFKEQEK